MDSHDILCKQVSVTVIQRENSIMSESKAFLESLQDTERVTSLKFPQTV